MLMIVYAVIVPNRIEVRNRRDLINQIRKEESDLTMVQINR